MLKRYFIILIILVFGMELFSCSTTTKKYTETEITQNSKNAYQFFESYFDEILKRSPSFQTYLGSKIDYDKLDNESEAFALEMHDFNVSKLNELKNIPYESLNEETQTSYRLFEEMLKEDIESFKWRYHSHPFNQMFGYQSNFPSFMINMHHIENSKDAESYISRIQAFPTQLNQVLEGVYKREEMGIIPPKFAFAKVRQDVENLLNGYPLTNDKKNNQALYEDFSNKIKNIKELSKAQRNQLKQKLAKSLKDDFAPSFKNFLTYWNKLEAKADDNNGVWDLPNGDEYYKFRLKKITTLNLSPSEIHNLGLSEVARIHDEMRQIMKTVKFNGTLKDFFKFVKDSPQFYYQDNKVGKDKYVSEATDKIETMKKLLPKMINILPKADLKVKAVEAFREKSAGLAFYQGPSPDGKRPGTYYVNTNNMKSLPIWEMEALAYHEGLPGHHMQITIATELTELPRFRRFGGYTAFSEGWGLYAEYFPKEFGAYKDPYSDFGRLSMELWRACRLVVDTGIHSQKWTREKAIQYLVDNTPSDDSESVKSIERYIVMPGQATAYKIGMNKILELRERSKSKLGSKFNLASFHDEVLRHGALPLNVLEEKIDKWILTQ